MPVSTCSYHGNVRAVSRGGQGQAWVVRGGDHFPVLPPQPPAAGGHRNIQSVMTILETRSGVVKVGEQTVGRPSRAGPTDVGMFRLVFADATGGDVNLECKVYKCKFPNRPL